MERKYMELVGAEFFLEARQAELNASIIRDQILEAETSGEARGVAIGEMIKATELVQKLMNKLNMDLEQAMEFYDFDEETKEKIRHRLGR